MKEVIMDLEVLVHLKPKKNQAILFLMGVNGVADAKMFVVNQETHADEVVAIRLTKIEV
jgi:hypothetical protein